MATDGRIPRRPISGPCPLSFSQQRLWFLDQLDPGLPVYNIPRALHLEGVLNVGALQASLDALVARHEALRTTFVSIDGTPMQVIGQPRPAELRCRDLAGLETGQRRESEIDRLLTEEIRHPFDLSSDPMLRASLLRLGEREHLLLLVTHHIGSDGWSMGVLFRELAALYAAFATGSPATLPELPIQYADYALWQREWLQGERLEMRLSYWKERLSDSPPTLDIPADRPRPTNPSFRGAQRTVLLPLSLASALRAVGRGRGATLFMTLLAAFQTLLQRYTGQDDIIVGSPIAGRTRVETEGLIGFFVNTLALRTDLSGDPSFLDLLGRVREVALGAFTHQELPFEKLVEELRPERGLGHTPLLRVAFALQNVPSQHWEMPGLIVTRRKLDPGTAKFDLTLYTTETPEGLEAVLEYSTDLFEAATVDRMLGHFQTLLEGIAANPDQKLSRLPLLTHLERNQLLMEWNRTGVEYPRDSTIHQLFERQADATPDAVAIVSENGCLTYRELNRRANQLAHHLQRHGAQTGTLVGICTDRTSDLIVGLLAILKAGGAYVPLDPNYPQERLAFMLQDAGLSVLVAHAHLIDRLPTHRAQLIALDSSWQNVAAESQEDPTITSPGDSLAYVVYTSGSTGKPKGVAIPHRAVLRLVVNSNYLQITPADRVAQLSNSSFDAATFEIWGALLNGARLVILDRELSLSPRDLGEQIDRHGITTLFLTTAWFNSIAREAPATFSKLRHLLFGGEAADPVWVREVLRHAPPERLLHMYGPTETTTFATCYQVEAVAEGCATVPIGRPIANTRAYLLDRHRNPVPIGVPGELYLGGDGLALGYLHRPELTAERFIPNPFGAEAGERLYRTGDLARYLPDGNLVFLGRLDQQIKIRGFRVEPGEIEAALAQHPAVRQAAVVAREDSPGDKRLAAYLVARDKRPSTEELSRFLMGKLPDFMVPSTFVFLDILPLTPNGKLDRQGLPAPNSKDLRRDSRSFVTARDGLELRLLRLWEKVLDVQPIGVTDDFFQLGGHSLLAVRLFAEIEKQWGRRLPLSVLFERATVEHLAERLRQAAGTSPWSSLVPIQPEGSRPPFFCVHGIGGEVLQYRQLARYLDPDQPVFGVQAQGLDGREPPWQSVEEMAAHYVQEIRSLQPEGPYYLGGFSSGGVWAFEIAQQLHARGEKVALLAMFDTGRPNYGRLLPIVERVRLHLARMRPLTTKRKLSYLLARADTVWNRLKEAATRLARWGLLKTRMPLPLAFRGVESATSMAYAGYTPRVYPARVTLFRATQHTLFPHYVRDPQSGWGELAAGGLEIHEVCATHTDILSEPYVQITAEKLTLCLLKARADCADAVERGTVPRDDGVQSSRVSRPGWPSETNAPPR